MRNMKDEKDEIKMKKTMLTKRGLLKKEIIEEMVPDIEKKRFSRRKLQNEIIAAKRVRISSSGFDKVGVFSIPEVNSKEELEVYVNRAHERLNSLPEDLENVTATITFKKPQAESRINDLISKHQLNSFGVKVEGTHGFTTMVKNPIDKNFLKDIKANILATYNKNKELAAAEPNQEKRQALEQELPKDFVETFETNKGIYAFYCKGKSGNLKKCKNEEEVYAVDVGPIEVRDGLLELETNLPSEIIVTPPGDVAYFVKKFKKKL